MNYINFSYARCKNCYKCLRSCPVKAIRFKNQQAQIVEERCISCGHCLEICPQNARKVISDLEIVKRAIALDKKIVASLAPSFAGYFDVEGGKVVSALRKMGFKFIEETAVGAQLVSDYYGDYILKNKNKNYITTACPSANYLIEKYFPELIGYMIPIVSPMLAHGKLLKKFYGEDSFVVFIGPCVAKKLEAKELTNNKVIDAVLTFEEINEWIKNEGINFNELNFEKFDNNATMGGRSFPMDGGIIKSMKEVLDKCNIEAVSVSGMDGCFDILNSIKEGVIKNKVIEINVCRGSCIGGPNMVNNEKKYYSRLEKVKKYIKEKDNNIDIEEKINDIDLSTVFKNKSLPKETINDEDIEKIMNKMGKYSKEDELNCGVCGYNTCKEKAQAILSGMAEEDMCLHFMRSKAESLSNMIFENTASCIILTDSELNIKEINPAAEDIFMVSSNQIKGKPLCILIDEDDFRLVKETGKSIMGKRVAYPKYNAIFIENIVYLANEDIILASMINIMEEEKNRQELIKVKEKTLDAAQQVIEKQMRIAQEIAGALGETTAETKAILTQLRKMVAGEDGDIK